MLRRVSHSSISVVTLNSRGLLALTLPTALEQPLINLQQRLFQELGLASAVALPPLLPLLWSSAPLALESTRVVARLSRLSLRLTGRPPEIMEGEIVLPIEIAPHRGGPESAAPLSLMRETAQMEAIAADRCGSLRDPETPFPLFDAIRLATAETPRSCELLSQLQGEPIRGESGAITVVSLRLLLGSEAAWWQHLYYEAVAQQRVTVRN